MEQGPSLQATQDISINSRNANDGKSIMMFRRKMLSPL